MVFASAERSALTVIPSEVEESRGENLRQFRGILRLRFAPLRMTARLFAAFLLCHHPAPQTLGSLDARAQTLQLHNLGSAGSQPACLGSLPRPGNGVTPRCLHENVAGTAAGNYRLAACAPQNSRTRSGHLNCESMVEQRSHNFSALTTDLY